MNGNKLLQRCTMYRSLFSISNCHLDLLEWCFINCYIILFDVAALVVSIACLLAKHNLQTNRMFTSVFLYIVELTLS